MKETLIGHDQRCNDRRRYLGVVVPFENNDDNDVTELTEACE
jgi:hypothetical protein